MDQAREFLAHFTGNNGAFAGYFIFYLMITGCGCGLPLNSDLTLIAASVLAAGGLFYFPLLLLLAFAGLLTGDSITFFSGRKWGLTLLQKRPLRWILSPSTVRSAEKTLQKNGSKYLMAIRFLPLIRSALFFASGTLKVEPRLFYLYNTVATLIYLPVLMGSSYLASQHIREIMIALKSSQFFLLGAAVLLAISLYFRSDKKSRQESENL